MRAWPPPRCIPTSHQPGCGTPTGPLIHGRPRRSQRHRRTRDQRGQPRAGARRTRRHIRVPGLAPPWLAAVRGHVGAVPGAGAAGPVLRRIPDPGPHLPAGRCRRRRVGAHPGAHDPHRGGRAPPRVAGGLDGHQPHARGPPGVRGHRVHLGAGDRAPHDTRLRRGRDGHDHRADPDHAPVAHLPRARRPGIGDPQQPATLRHRRVRTSRLQPGHHHRMRHPGRRDGSRRPGPRASSSARS